MQLPHITAPQCDLFERHNIKTIKDLQALLVAPQPNRYQKILQDILRGNQQHISELNQVLKSFPQLSLSFNLFTLTAENEWSPLSSASGNLFQVTRNVSTELKIELTVHGGAKANPDGEKIYSPRYHKSKTISWWLVLGTASGELLAMKRIGNVSSSHVTQSLLFSVPAAAKDGEEDHDYLVFLIPDCIYGIETLAQFRLS